jgi:hypothetical protein
MLRKHRHRTRVSPHPRLTQAHAAQGGVTLGPEQGELGANFCYLGERIFNPISDTTSHTHKLSLKLPLMPVAIAKVSVSSD